MDDTATETVRKPAGEPEAIEQSGETIEPGETIAPAELISAELLVEEISIDGMCGVY